MHRKKDGATNAAGTNLRRRAEGRIDDRRRKLDLRACGDFDDTQRLVHELDVHKIELELQNEELRRTGASLESSLAQYAELYDFAPVGYLTLDRLGTIERANLTGARMLGVERTRLLHRRFEPFVSREDRSVFNTFLDHVFAGAGHASCDVTIEPRRSTGSAEPVADTLIHVHLAARLADNKEVCWALAMDVTEETKAVRALRESELRFRTLVEAMEDSVVTTDREGRITSARSKRWERLGLPAATFLGKGVGDIYGAEAGVRHQAAHARVLEGEPVVYEWKHQIDEVQFQMQTIASPLRDTNGQIVGSLDVSRDLTEVKKLYEEVLVSDRMSSLGILAAGLAHEINNPLAVVMANLDAVIAQVRLAGGVEAPAPADLNDILETLEDCLDSADRVRQIVRDLKIFSRPDEKSHGHVDLRRVVEASLKLAKNEIRHRARVITDFGDVAPVLGNEARLGQVFVNLLVNAAQSMPEGQVERHSITIRTLTHESGCAVVEVRDTGPGIPPEIAAHIFEPFFTTKPIGAGTGLGLAICQRIVTGFGGQITVDSEVGKGTRFRVVLPAALDDTTETEVREALPAPTGRRAKILLIDDDPATLKATARTLSARHEVTSVLRAREALERITAGEHFDLVISDLMMPEMTGMDLHRALAAIAPLHAQHMIFLTGGAFTPGAREFLGQVDNLRLDKPFERQGLLALVGRAVQ